MVLVAAGASLDAADDYGNTPLHAAAAHKRGGATVRALLAGGASVTATTKAPAWFTPLHSAAQCGAVEPAQELIRAGAAVGAAPAPGSAPLADEGSSAPLHLAAQYGHTGMCRLLLAAGADVNAISFQGAWPLHCAASHLDTALLLIRLGAGTDSKLFADTLGRGPLEAAAAGNAEYLQALRAEAGAQRCCAQCGEARPSLRCCARCLAARYCGRECQAAHWQQHKAQCRRPKVVFGPPGFAPGTIFVAELERKPT